ncbi:MAG: histidine kinase [Eubacterium sp.]|nr:histidine kinase [Eubacterium sp.]
MRDLSLHILDIVQNSISAGASVITIQIKQGLNNALLKNNLEITITDNGKGMDSELIKKAEDPFVTTRTSRKVGLGIPLIKESAEMCNGEFKLNSQINRGTEVFAAFSIDHIDRLPLGDIGETMLALISSNPGIQFMLLLSSKKGDFMLDTAQLAKSLEGIKITEYAVLNWLKEYVDNGIKNIFGGVLNEVDSRIG